MSGSNYVWIILRPMDNSPLAAFTTKCLAKNFKAHKSCEVIRMRCGRHATDEERETVALGTFEEFCND